MIAVFMVVFILVDGLVSLNPQPWAAPIRAGLVAVLFLIGLAWLWRAGIRVSIVTATLIGILAALVVSDTFHNIGTGISSWMLYAGVYAAQRATQRDWRSDLALTGVILSALWIVLTLAGLPPGGLWNRNVVGGTIAVTLPASTTLVGWKRWVEMSVIAAGIIATLSRGAMFGAAVGLAVLFQPWALLTAPALLIALCSMRGWQTQVRWLYFAQGVDLIKTSPFFGAGPRFVVAGDGVGGVGIHVHNTLLGIAAQVGGVGIGIIAAALALARHVKIERWQLASLLTVAAHSLVDDPLCWWPVGIALGLILGSSFNRAENTEARLR